MEEGGATGVHGNHVAREFTTCKAAGGTRLFAYYKHERVDMSMALSEGQGNSEAGI